ncbi:MAG: hypothetical protein WCT04_17415 [Planctomycetota bacterium]
MLKLTNCNEPVAPLSTLRSPRVWQTILSPDLPGKIMLAQMQLNHGLVDDDEQKLDKKLMALYGAVIAKFAALHGDGTRCFLVRAPESLNVVGHHIRAFGGATNGLAWCETVLCVSPRTDGKVTIAHLEDNFGSVEFDLHDGLPKARVLNWPAHVSESRTKATASGVVVDKSKTWCGVVRNALQYYVNRHKGPTGQVELPISGLNIVVGAIRPKGTTSHSETTLAAAALVAVMASTGEWGKMPLSEFETWVNEAQFGGHGRRCETGPIVFGMPNELIHIDWNPARAKGKALPHGFSFLTAHTGPIKDPAHSKDTVDALKTPSVRAATTTYALELFRHVALESKIVPLNDEDVYSILLQIPERATLAQLKDLLKGALPKTSAHPEPADGYNLREKLLFVLSEMRRSDRAANVIRSGDAAAFGALMTIGQAGEANIFHDVAPMGRIAGTFAIPSYACDETIHSLADNVDPLWKQTGKSGASSPETDLICDVATAITGVLGARYCDPMRVVILCKTEVLQIVKDELVSSYYTPRGLPTDLIEQVYPCQGAGVVAI